MQNQVFLKNNHAKVLQYSSQKILTYTSLTLTTVKKNHLKTPSSKHTLKNPKRLYTHKSIHLIKSPFAIKICEQLILKSYKCKMLNNRTLITLIQCSPNILPTLILLSLSKNKKRLKICFCQISLHS